MSQTQESKPARDGAEEGRTCTEDFDVPGVIRRVRRIAGMSQAEIADRLGIAQSSLARWENGSKEPSLARLQQLLAVAGLGLAAVAADGERIPPMRSDAVRNLAGHRLPSHLPVLPAVDLDRFCQENPRLATAVRRRPEDRHSTEGDGGDTRRYDDHPTAAEIICERQAARAERAARARQRLLDAQAARSASGLPRYVPRCLCCDACFEGRYCAADCVCQCDPAPGWDWGPVCSLRARRGG